MNSNEYNFAKFNRMILSSSLTSTSGIIKFGVELHSKANDFIRLTMKMKKRQDENP